MTPSPSSRPTRNVWVVTLTSFLTDVSSEMLASVLPLFLANVLGARTAAIGSDRGRGGDDRQPVEDGLGLAVGSHRPAKGTGGAGLRALGLRQALSVCGCVVGQRAGGTLRRAGGQRTAHRTARCAGGRQRRSATARPGVRAASGRRHRRGSVWNRHRLARTPVDRSRRGRVRPECLPTAGPAQPDPRIPGGGRAGDRRARGQAGTKGGGRSCAGRRGATPGARVPSLRWCDGRLHAGQFLRRVPDPRARRMSG